MACVVYHLFLWFSFLPWRCPSSPTCDRSANRYCWTSLTRWHPTYQTNSALRWALTYSLSSPFTSRPIPSLMDFFIYASAPFPSLFIQHLLPAHIILPHTPPQWDWVLFAASRSPGFYLPNCVWETCWMIIKLLKVRLTFTFILMCIYFGQIPLFGRAHQISRRPTMLFN